MVELSREGFCAMRLMSSSFTQMRLPPSEAVRALKGRLRNSYVALPPICAGNFAANKSVKNKIWRHCLIGQKYDLYANAFSVVLLYRSGTAAVFNIMYLYSCHFTLMNYILFDDNRAALLPLSFSRPVSEMRIGTLTIREKWERHLSIKVSWSTEDYLSKKFPAEFAIDEDNVWINGSVCPNSKLVEEIAKLAPGQELVAGETLIARNTGDEKVLDNKKSDHEKFESHAKAFQLCNLWDIFSKNGEQLAADFELDRWSHLYWEGCRDHGRKYDSRTLLAGRAFCFETGS